MKIVEYTTDEGYKQMRGVPETAGEDTYHMGVVIGPPDIGSLSQLGLNESTIKCISNRLVDAGFYSVDTVRGKRRAMQTLIGMCVDDSAIAKRARQHITAKYQADLIVD